MAKTYIDFIGGFDAGVNGGIEPLLLPKNQLAYGNNTTVRGAFVTHRPPYIKHTLTFPDAATQAIVEDGLFQGAGWYRPDYGLEQLIAHISGHLLSFTETGDTFTVADISVAGDLNSADALQAWMWQAERWLIATDGTGALPIFYDGATSRRSYGASVVLGTLANPFAIPAIGSTGVATLAANYTGPFNVPVLLNGEFYQTVLALPGGENCVLTNIAATVGANVASGAQVYAMPSRLAICTLGATVVWGQDLSVKVSTVLGMSVGQIITFPNASNSCGIAVKDFAIVSIDAGTETIVVSPYKLSGCPAGTGTHTINTGSLVLVYNSSAPNVLLGTTQADFLNPAVDGTVNVKLDTAYSGTADQSCWIVDEQYLINPIPTPGASTNLTLLNLTDGSAGPVAAGEHIMSVPELPAGRMGCYGMGRVAMCLTNGITFTYGDICGGASGTAAYDYRDAVLKTTENTFQSGGGDFNLPSSGQPITAMLFGANLDAALGQGPLQVGTAEGIFTCQVGFDRTAWASTTNPILTQALIGRGPLAQDSTILINSDTFFRSTEGLASLVLARRDFSTWGNVPISQEMQQVFQADTESLLAYSRQVEFDNRSLTTASPRQVSRGVVHSLLVATNFDTVSNLRTKLPPVYDGVWSGLDILKHVAFKINGQDRCFAFVVNPETNKIELVEFLKSATTETQDNETTPITWYFDTTVLFNRDIKPINELTKLDDGEIYTKDVTGSVVVTVQYRADFNPTWSTWRTFTMDSTNWNPRLGLGDPGSAACDTATKRQARVGYFFQFRVKFVGSCKFMGMRVSASTQPDATFAKPLCST